MPEDRTARSRRIRWDLFDAVNGAVTPERIRAHRRRRWVWIAFSVLGVLVFGAASIVSSQFGVAGSVATYAVAIIMYCAMALVAVRLIRC